MLTRWRERREAKRLYNWVRAEIAAQPKISYVTLTKLSFSPNDVPGDVRGQHWWYFEPYNYGGISLDVCLRRLGWRNAALSLLHEYGHHLQWTTGYTNKRDQVHYDIRNGRKTQRLITLEQDAWTRAIMLWVGYFGQNFSYRDLAFVAANYTTYWRWEDMLNLLTTPVAPDKI